MSRPALPRLGRGGLLLAGCVVGADATWLLARGPLTTLVVAVRGPGGLAALPLDSVLVGVCAGLLLGCVLWLLVVTGIVIASYVARELSPAGAGAATLSRWERRGCPALVQHLVTAALGVAVTTGVAGPALADTCGTHPLDGLAVPDRTSGSVPAAPAPRTEAPPPTRTVVVRHGDSLWSIAADRLPGTATDLQVTEAWHRLHRANAVRVGTDPDLILPGTRLVVPDLRRPPRKDAS